MTTISVAEGSRDTTRGALSVLLKPLEVLIFAAVQ
jgi:hypothetical protein